MSWMARFTDLLGDASVAADQAEQDARNMEAVATNERDPRAREFFEDEARNWRRIARTFRGGDR